MAQRKSPQSMFKFFRNLFVFTLLIGLILAEVFVNTNQFQPNPANSQRQLTGAEQNTILSILKGGDGSPLPTPQEPSSDFLNIDIPNPSDILRDAQYASGLIYRSLGSTVQTPSLSPADNYLQTPTSAEDILATILPPAGSPLYVAYQEGGKAWYYDGVNVLVIFADETIRSFNKNTGAETTWLQKELAYPPVEDSNAIVNYRSNYNAEIVAQTSTWVLMKFPSGGLLKVAKPTYQSAGDLPEVLPGYENL
ncbi:MAG: hypothetical protein PHR51_01770 [Patescibacteria group bacterium]|nr:hypothetical protein [Patescibacteria group bacterium]